MVSNPAPSLSAHSGQALEYKACWEEPSTTEEMVQVEHLLAEIAELTARKLIEAVEALSFCKRLMQPIQERVHPAYEYWGREDPTQGQNRKVSRVEVSNRVARIMAGQIQGKGCSKALCLNVTPRPTREVENLSDETEELCSSSFFPDL